MSNKAVENVTVDQLQTLELYSKALTYNVIGKYDPKIKHLITHTYHSTVFKYDSKTENWNKLEIEGVLALYSRNSNVSGVVPKLIVLNEESYTFGLIILNRLNTENFTVGLMGSSKIEGQDSGLKLEMRDGLMIIKSLSDDTFGLWIHDEKVREDFYKSLEYIINN